MNPLRRAALAATTTLLAGIPLHAQDLLGVTWNGATVLVDSYTGGVTPLGTGLAGQNCLARTANGEFWSTRRLSSVSYQFTRIDPNTGSATSMFSGVDIRGLATGPANTLYGIQDGAGGDLLVTINSANGAINTIGNTGFTGIQGLAVHQGVLYAWDVFAGLLTVDPATGIATDPFPAVGGPAYQQSLCSHPDGRLLLGGGDSNGTDQLFAVDPSTGIASLIGFMAGAVDVRGLEPLGGYANPFGRGCDGTFGAVSLGVSGRIRTGGSFNSISTNHAANAPGALLIGLSDSSFAGFGLPLTLDPLLGTHNCSLHISIEASVATVSGATTPAILQSGLAIPPSAAGATIYLQHICFEPVAGGSSWSNGVAVHVE